MKKVAIRLMSVILATALSASLKTGINARAYYDIGNSNLNMDINKSNDGTVIYTNKLNGKQYIEYSDGTTSGDEDFRISSDDTSLQEVVELNEYTNYEVYLPGEATEITDIKITKGKKNITVKPSYTYKRLNWSEYMKKSSDGRYYYYDYTTGNRVYVESTDNKKPEVLTNISYYKFRIFGKQLGKSEITFNYRDKYGNILGTKKWLLMS